MQAVWRSLSTRLLSHVPLTGQEPTLPARPLGDGMNTKTLTPDMAVLDADECFALRQLCSTAYLSAGRLSDTACAGLLQAGLAWKDRDGFWSATDKGQHAFRRLEDERASGRFVLTQG